MREDEAVDRRAAKLSALLRATDVPAPPMAFPAERIAHARRRTRLQWQLAAAAALLVLVAGTVRPVRAWIAETARHFFLGSPGTAAPASAPADSASAPVMPVPSNVVTFTPRAGSFIVEIAVRQQGGTLVLAPVGGIEASAAIMGDAADAELLVRPDGVRIGNRASAQADYVVRVPPSVARVTVRIGREPARSVDVPREYDLRVSVGPRADRPE
jgi:hypothetical protein